MDTAPKSEHTAILTENLDLWYSDFQALIDVSSTIKGGLITALIGPSGCGKTTLLRCFNRMNERFEGVRIEGGIRILGKNIFDEEYQEERDYSLPGRAFYGGCRLKF